MTDKWKAEKLKEIKEKYPTGTKSKFPGYKFEDIVTRQLEWQSLGISHEGIYWVYKYDEDTGEEIYADILSYNSQYTIY